MKQEEFAASFEAISRNAEHVIETSLENWPSSITSVMFSEVAYACTLSPERLHGYLSSNQNYRLLHALSRPIETDYPEIPDLSHSHLFPKLGPVSWQDNPALTSLDAKTINMTLPNVLAAISDRMCLILSAFTYAKVPTRLYLLGWRNVSNFSEIRMFATGKTINGGSWRTTSKTNVSNKKRIETKCLTLAKAILRELNLKKCTIDLMVDENNDTSDPRIYLLEINPVLEA